MPIYRHDGKLIYFAHVPKCGGMAVEGYLSRRLGKAAFLNNRYLRQRRPWTRTSPQHVAVHDLLRLFPQGFFDHSFAVVRHPATRIVSAFFFQRDVEKKIPKEKRFAEWLQGLPKVVDERPAGNDNHFLPQSRIVPPGAEVFKLEDGLEKVREFIDGIVGASDESIEIEVINPRKLREEITLSDEDHKIIETIYAEDYDRFGYPRNEGAKEAPAEDLPQELVTLTGRRSSQIALPMGDLRRSRDWGEYHFGLGLQKGFERAGHDAVIAVQDRWDQQRRRRRASSGVIAIKTCVPSMAVKESWGDYHFARSLVQAFERLGRKARVDIMPDWTSAPSDDALDIVLQGHDHHPPREGIPSLLWMIYPGKRFDHGRLIDYDHVLVASGLFSRRLARRVPGLVPSVLYQAFDAEVMRPPRTPRRKDIVFVGNNHFRLGDRPMATYARQGGHPLRLWGRGWEGPEWAPHLEAEMVANAELGKVYGDSIAVLCDHTKIMARNGFLSNRVFDALACAAPVVTDPVAEVPEGFADWIFVVSNQEEFDAAMADIAQETSKRRTERRKFATSMRDRHSFDQRVKEILAILE